MEGSNVPCYTALNISYFLLNDVNYERKNCVVREKMKNLKEEVKTKFNELIKEIEQFRSDKKLKMSNQLSLYGKDIDLDDQVVIVQFRIKKLNREDFEEEVQYDIEVAPADINFKLFERDFNDFINDPKLIEVYSYNLI